MGNSEGTTKGPAHTPESTDDLSSGATSKKTLSDIEETEKDTGPASSDHSSPSLDGAFDEPGEQSKTGPM
ncbi:MAG: hypothetical protein JWM21_1003 [Acidobacteria bacterium]|nr:hypothetical protein [Acidobacteriota bacterium]